MDSGQHRAFLKNCQNIYDVYPVNGVWYLLLMISYGGSFCLFFFFRLNRHNILKNRFLKDPIQFYIMRNVIYEILNHNSIECVNKAYRMSYVPT